MTRLELVSRDWHTPMFALTPHSQIGATDETRTRTVSLEDSDAAITLRSHLELVTGVEPATDCLQDSCSAVEPHQHFGSGAGI